MSIKHQVGHNLRRLRLAAKLSQEALANEAGVAMNYVSGIERGVKNPSIQILDDLAKVLKVHAIEFFRPVSSREPLSSNLKPGRRITKDRAAG